MGAVAVLRVGGRDVDVPAALEGVEFGGPQVGGVVCVGRWEPVMMYEIGVLFALDGREKNRI